MSIPPQRKSASAAPTIRPMVESDLPDARRIFQLAFGTFIGVPDPASFLKDVDFFRPRWAGGVGSAFVAEIDGRIVGSNLVSNWGSFGFFGPLTIHPERWDQGIAQHLMGAAMDTFRDWGVRHCGLFTFPQSAKHVNLYQKYGFWPRFLTALMARPAERRNIFWRAFSQLSEAEQSEALRACRELTDAIFDGLDVSREIRAIAKLQLGDTLLLCGGDRLDGFACCHCGAETEAGDGTCYIKFGAVRSGPDAEQLFDALLDECESFAAERGLARIEAGVNLGRDRAYRRMRGRGYQTLFQGIAMHRPNESGFCNSGDYVIDDWR
ncbi:MAG: GNAT family N-acetyltransferase [Acidobacteriaceae bacterium]